jgi:hypothetical protein
VAGVYSKRFILGQGVGPFSYTVPLGKVAVVKCLTAVNGQSQAVAGAIYVGSVNLWIGSVPGTASAEITGLQIVLNAGETLYMSGNSPGLGLSAHGYLLDALA